MPCEACRPRWTALDRERDGHFSGMGEEGARGNEETSTSANLQGKGQLHRTGLGYRFYVLSTD